MNQTFFATTLREREFSFSTRNDFVQWLHAQAEFWRPVAESERANLDTAQREFFNIHQAFYDRISDPQLDDENILRRAQDYFSVLTSYGFPEAGTPSAELMREAALQLPFDIARAMARSFAGEVTQPRSAVSVYDIIGPVFASMSRLPSLSALHPLRGSALEEHEKIISSRNQQSQEEIRRAIDDADLATKHAQQFTAESQEEFERRWNLQQSAANEQVAKAIDELRTTEKTYKEHMKLRAPVHYWEEKDGPTD
jgi:hypothetical protein